MTTTVDLTKITTPFGLLDEVYGPGTQRALIECGGPWEYWVPHAVGWVEGTAFWYDGVVYRQKPQPREYVAWQVINAEGHPHAFYTREERAAEIANYIGGRVIKLTGYDDDTTT